MPSNKMLKKFLLILFVSLALLPVSVCSQTKKSPQAKKTKVQNNKDTVFIRQLNDRFTSGDASAKSAVIDLYIDSVGVASNDFLKFITLTASPFDFSTQQKNRIFDSASTKYNETRILTYLNFFRERAYIPIVKEWYAKSDKRGKFTYESLMFEFGDKEVRDLWEGALKSCSKTTKTVPSVIGNLFPVICGKFPDRRFCDLIIDFLVDHESQYFVFKDMKGITEYDDVVYYISFFLVDRVKGFPDAFVFNKYERSSGTERYVSFTRSDREIIMKWCRTHRRDYEFEE